MDDFSNIPKGMKFPIIEEQSFFTQQLTTNLKLKDDNYVNIIMEALKTVNFNIHYENITVTENETSTYLNLVLKLDKDVKED